MPPQPVPPPQMVPPPSVSQIQHSMNIITSVPPPSHPPPQAAPWLFQGQPLPQPSQVRHFLKINFLSVTI